MNLILLTNPTKLMMERRKNLTWILLMINLMKNQIKLQMQKTPKKFYRLNLLIIMMNIQKKPVLKILQLTLLNNLTWNLKVNKKVKKMLYLIRKLSLMNLQNQNPKKNKHSLRIFLPQKKKKNSKSNNQTNLKILLIL